MVHDFSFCKNRILVTNVTSGVLSTKHVYNGYLNSNYSKGSLNSFAHETDKKLHCLCIPRGLQLTFIHFVMDIRK